MGKTFLELMSRFYEPARKRPGQAAFSQVYLTCSITRLVIEQVLQNARHFAAFKWKLF
jgi:hypothetical protein